MKFLPDITHIDQTINKPATTTFSRKPQL